MAAAFGPREADKSSLLTYSSSSSSFTAEGRIAVDLRSAPFSGGSANSIFGGSRTRPAQTVAERAAAASVAAALSPLVISSGFPKLVVDVCVVVLEDGGSSLAAAALAAGAALADAGVPMSGVLGAAAVARAPGKGKILLDPSAEEEASADARCELLAVCSNSSCASDATITQVCFCGGGWTADGTEAAVAAGTAAAGAAADAVRGALRKGRGGEGGDTTKAMER